MPKRPAVVSLALGLVLALGGGAHAQDLQAAAKEFTAAQSAFTKRQYAKAAAGFKAAYDMTKDPVLLYNVAESWDKAGKPALAVQYYRAYVAEQPRAADRLTVERRIQALETKYHLPPPPPTPITPSPAPRAPGAAGAGNGMAAGASDQPAATAKSPTTPARAAGEARNPAPPNGSPAPRVPGTGATPGHPAMAQMASAAPATPPPGSTPAPPPAHPAQPAAPPSAPSRATSPAPPSMIPPVPREPLQPAGTPAFPERPGPAATTPAEHAVPPLAPPLAAAPGATPTTVPPPPPSAPIEPAHPASLVDEDHPSGLKITAWVGVAATVALLTTGAIFGLAAQVRSDELSRRASTADPSGRPPAFTAGEETQYNQLRDQGQLYNTLGLGLMAASAATAVTSAILFMVDRGLHGHRKQVRITPSPARHGGGLAASLEF